jgi:hypothetical protein
MTTESLPSLKLTLLLFLGNECQLCTYLAYYEEQCTSIHLSIDSSTAILACIRCVV